jgi:hypothetical protein
VTGMESVASNSRPPRRRTGRLIRGKPQIKKTLEYPDERPDPIPLPGHHTDGQPTHLHPRWGGRRAGSGRKPSGAPSNAKFLRVTCTLAPRHVALLLMQCDRFKTSSLSEALREVLEEYLMVTVPIKRIEKVSALLDEMGASLAPAHGAAYAKFEQAEEERRATEDTR